MALTLQQISDRIEIQDALLAYSVALDHPGRRWELWYDCFHPDAVCHYPGMEPAKPAELQLMFDKNTDLRLSIQHLFLNIFITLEGDEAEVRSEVLFAALNRGATPQQATLIRAGLWFEDKFRRYPQGWRLYHRVAHARWSESTEQTLPG